MFSLPSFHNSNAFVFAPEERYVYRPQTSFGAAPLGVACCFSHCAPPERNGFGNWKL